MKIKIVSDGLGVHTKVVNIETGEELHNISFISWQMDAVTREANVTIKLFAVPLEAVGDKLKEIVLSNDSTCQNS